MIAIPSPAGRRVFALVATFCLAMAAGGHAEDELNIYTSRHYDSDLVLYRTFTDETGIAVNAVEGKAGALIERIKAEGANSPGDILFTVDAGNLAAAAAEGLFRPVRSEVLEARLPAVLRQPEGLWFGLTQRARLIMYRKGAVDVSTLAGYEDLADERWRDTICVRPSGNIYNQSLVASLIVHNGEEETAAWIRGLVANMAREPQSNDTGQIKAVAAGECDIAIANSYYLARLMRSSDPDDRAVADAIGVILPNQDGRGAHVNISGAGVLLHAPHAENAVRFLEFLTGDEAQSVFAQANNEWPAVPGVPHVEVLERLYGEFKADSINPAEFGAYRSAALSLMEANGWD